MKKVACLLFFAFQGVLASNCQAVFTKIWETHYWGGASLSGTGSDLIQTEKIRNFLPQLLQRYNCRSMIDAPCGDFYWMQDVDLPLDRYVGIDVVLPLVAKNQM